MSLGDIRNGLIEALSFVDQLEVSGARRRIDEAIDLLWVEISDFGEVRKDAERYQFLKRENAMCAGEGHGFSVCLEVREDGEIDDDVWVGVNLSDVIDAKMADKGE